MKKRYFFLMLIALMSLTSIAAQGQPLREDLRQLQLWQAGCVVSAEAVSKALALAEKCEKVVCAAEGFGTMTAENRRILTWAEEMGKLLPLEALNTL